MGHWARCLSGVWSTSRAPFIPISAPTLPSLGIPPPSRHGKTRASGPSGPSCPQRSFQRPRRRDSSREPCVDLTHASAATHQGAAGPKRPSPVLSCPARPLPSHQGCRSSTPIPPFGIGPPNIPQVPLVIFGRHGFQSGYRTRPSYTKVCPRVPCPCTSSVPVCGHRSMPTSCGLVYVGYDQVRLSWVRVSDHVSCQHVQGLGNPTPLAPSTTTHVKA